MQDLQQCKALLRRFHEELDATDADGIDDVFGRYSSDDYLWRGMHPFNELAGADAVANTFWKPFRRSVASIQRRPDVFFAGMNEIDGFQSAWVCSMGHLMGLFDEDWLGIPATGKMIFLRYAEFNRVAGGKLRETALFCDIISVMRQAGLNPLPPQTGAFFITPGPRTHDGLLHEEQDPAEGQETLELIKRMVADLVTSGMESPQDELARTWHDDMIWFGPAGIGATYTRARYQQQHQGPFREGLKDIQFNGHKCFLTEGCYGGFFGWPNLTMKSAGGFMGLPASDRITEMRVVDIYRRERDKLAENWIFIDLLHFLALQGLDLLDRIGRFPRT